MLNERDNKNENPEESEYHFSDDDINYDLETESQKPAAVAATTTSKLNIISSLSRSKRMVISLVIFLILVFIVYKMVTPSSVTNPNLDITPGLSRPTAATTGIKTTTTTTPQGTQITQTQVMTPVQPTMQTTSGIPAQPNAASAPQQPALSQMPAVVPVPSAQPYSYPTTSPVNNDKLAELQKRTDAAMSELEANYNLKLNEYNMQNKALQDKLDALNSKVAVMESQFNQLIQVLTKNAPAQTQEAPVKTSETKIPYVVQAIIPGRAWLKSFSGETLTVAEGDMIKDVGRVTKIDPYDGIVEINTGNKVVSLSYGSGG